MAPPGPQNAKEYEELATKILKNIRPNPVTGRVEIDDIGKYLMENMDNPDLAQFAQLTDTLDYDQKQQDLTKFDFNSLKSTIKENTLCYVGLAYQGHFNRSGDLVPPEKIPFVSDARPRYVLACFEGKHMRGYEECGDTLPTSDVESTFVLRPFLDTLPKPFHWLVESREEEQRVKDIAHAQRQELMAKCMAMGNRYKEQGNQAFKAGKRDEALQLYQAAIDAVYKIWGGGDPDKEQERKAYRLIAMCYANRSAAWMIEGEGGDAEKALDAGKKAEHTDPGYAKGYFRQARALGTLGKIKETQEVIIRGLKRPELERDSSLAEVLIELQTGGKGLPDDLESFKQWFTGVTETDLESAKRLEGLGCAWVDRCNDHKQKLEQHLRHTPLGNISAYGDLRCTRSGNPQPPPFATGGYLHPAAGDLQEGEISSVS
ncbi:hypothetical protein PQX77_010369 [Marasmius sp. AFHP31]|nr:hypothetical protein PQX77_010369 [Marasmius sp. AFHP31]